MGWYIEMVLKLAINLTLDWLWVWYCLLRSSQDMEVLVSNCTNFRKNWAFLVHSALDGHLKSDHKLPTWAQLTICRSFALSSLYQLQNDDKGQETWKTPFSFLHISRMLSLVEGSLGELVIIPASYIRKNKKLFWVFVSVHGFV